MLVFEAWELTSTVNKSESVHLAGGNQDGAMGKGLLDHQRMKADGRTGARFQYTKGLEMGIQRKPSISAHSG